MLPEMYLSVLATAVLALPLAAFLVLGGVAFVHRAPSERTIARVTATALTLALAGSLAVLASVLAGPRHAFSVHLGRWFALPGYAFELSLLVDRLTAALMVLTTGITGLIGMFSVTYMHRERGYARFFLLTHLFAGGMLLLVMAGSVDLLFAGWELVGISSVLLIGFFDQRNAPVQSGLRAYVTYRVCDMGLLLGAVLVHHYAHTAQLDAALSAGHWPLGSSHLGQGPATLIALLFTLGAIGKSAQLPGSGWLPRAMEGPTPSSALFYGALSVHAGVYLLLRTAPLFDEAPLARAVLIAVGALSAVYATITGRAQTDAKNILAYATITQVGLMFVEIGLGWHVLAMVHLVGHACVRSYQLLRAPSALHEAHLLHGAAGGIHLHTGAHLEGALPRGLQRWLYGLAIERFHIDTLLDGVARAALALARRLDALDRRWVALQSGEPAPLPWSAAAASRDSAAADRAAADAERMGRVQP